MPMEMWVCQRRFLLRLTNRVLAVVWVLAMAVMISSCTPLLMTPVAQSEGSVAKTEGRLIVQITYPTVDVLNELAGELDIWEVDRAAQTLIARITLEQYTALRQPDLIITLDCAKMRQYAQQNNLSLPDIAKLMQEECPEK